MGLTKRQKQILDFIEEYLDSKGFSPSIEEIRDHLKLSAVSTVHKHLSNLEKRGYIARRSNAGRSIRLIPEGNFAAAEEVPLLGTIAAGRPIEAVEEGEEKIPVPSEMVNGKDTYILKVSGDSMIEECIADGDFVIVEHRNHAHDGETVVALIEKDEVTLKKFYRGKKGGIRLQPANARMEPIFIDEKELDIQGVVIGILRKY